MPIQNKKNMSRNNIEQNKYLPIKIIIISPSRCIPKGVCKLLSLFYRFSIFRYLKLELLISSLLYLSITFNTLRWMNRLILITF